MKTETTWTFLCLRHFVSECLIDTLPGSVLSHLSPGTQSLDTPPPRPWWLMSVWSAPGWWSAASWCNEGRRDTDNGVTGQQDTGHHQGCSGHTPRRPGVNWFLSVVGLCQWSHVRWRQQCVTSMGNMMVINNPTTFYISRTDTNMYLTYKSCWIV